MAEIETAEIDVQKLTIPTLKVLKAATLYGFKNESAGWHTISIKDFCQMAGLSEMPKDDLKSMFSNAQKALGIVQAMDIEVPEREDARYRSWQLLEDFDVTADGVGFELSRLTFDVRIRCLLLALKP